MLTKFRSTVASLAAIGVVLLCSSQAFAQFAQFTAATGSAESADVNGNAIDRAGYTGAIFILSLSAYDSFSYVRACVEIYDTANDVWRKISCSGQLATTGVEIWCAGNPVPSCDSSNTSNSNIFLPERWRPVIDVNGSGTFTGSLEVFPIPWRH